MDVDDSLTTQALRALQKSSEYAFNSMKDDSHWVAECYSNATFTAECIFLRQALGLDLSADHDAYRNWLFSQQNADGSWGLAPGYDGDVSTTTEAYLALKILHVPPDDPAMCRAREFMIRSGGAEKVRMFTRLFLATFGLLPWDAVPQIPMELILMPSFFPINMYALSSWARSTLIGVLVVRHHQPIYALPNGKSASNDFLDEIWVNPANKSIPYAPQLWGLLKEKDVITFTFTALDKLISYLGGLRRFPLRGYVRQQCVKWILEHQEESGDWAGYWPPMDGAVRALVLEGYALDHPVVKRGLEAMERFMLHDKNGKRVQATVSPVWDTALMNVALNDAGLCFGDRRLQRAIDWVKARQVLGEEGDWRVYAGPSLAPGGWSFEYHNSWFPDVDDTAVVVLGLVKHDPQSIGLQCVSAAVEWILGMQNRDGGWAAFDKNNDHLFLNKIPFSDMNSLCDPSTADVSGRILECFGMLLTHPLNHLLAADLLERLRASSRRGLTYLLSQQEAIGAWWGRWGVNYVYGTSNVLCGLKYFSDDDKRVKASVLRATRWLRSVQNADGGWGEGLDSYADPGRAGCGQSTPSQTAWGLMALLAHLPPLEEAIQRGVAHLVSTQTDHGSKGATWEEKTYTGTGFPFCLYLEYSLYPHYFPMMALGRYVQATGGLAVKHVNGCVK